jgi:hypothetical protein
MDIPGHKGHKVSTQPFGAKHITAAAVFLAANDGGSLAGFLSRAGPTLWMDGAALGDGGIL